MNLKLFPAILIVFFTIGCAKPAETQADDLVFDSNDINQTIAVSAPEGCNHYLINQGVCLAVELTGDSTICINTSKVVAYEYTGENWRKVVDFKVPDILYVISPNDNYILRSAVINIEPNFENTSEPITVRFIVFGNIYENEIIGDPIVGYVDVVLNP